MLQCLKKEIATTKELDLRQLGKVIIFRDKQTNRQLLLYIDEDNFGDDDQDADCADYDDNDGDYSQGAV